MPNAECRMPKRNKKADRAIELARALYRKHGGDLEKDLVEFTWPNGVIVDLPHCFAIAYVTPMPSGERAWFIKTAVGDLRELLKLFPITLPFVAFHREKTGDKLKFYRTSLLIRMAAKLARHHSLPVTP